MEQISHMPLKQTQEPPVTVKKGDIHRAQIIERGDNNEAVVRIRGKNVNVQFEDGIPKEDKISLQVTGKREDKFQVRTVASSPAHDVSGAMKHEKSVMKVIDQAGIEKPTPELIQAAKTLQKHDIPLTRETLQVIDEFISKSPGSRDETMAVIKAAALKSVKMTEQNLAYIREGLQGKSVAEIMNESTGQRTSDKALSSQIEKAVETAIKQAASNIKNGEETLINKNSNNYSSQYGGWDTLQTLIRKLKAEPDIIRLLDPIKKWADTLPKNMRDYINSTTDETEYLINHGKEMAARKLLSEMLYRTENKLQELLSRNSYYTAETHGLPEAPSAGAQTHSKQFLETRITEKILQISGRFESLKNDTNKSLEQTIRLLQSKPAVPHASQVLDGTIKQLDRMILKSEVMMYADMKTERNILKASAQLSEAKQLLKNGNIEAARTIVEDVQRNVDGWKVQTSEQKVKHMVMGQLAKTTGSGLRTAIQHTAEQAQLVRQEPAARQVFELIRSLGLNRESEIGQMLASGKKGDPGEHNAFQQQNLKDALLKFIKSDEAGNRLNQQASQTLSNISGQQLLSKTDAPNMQQQLLFNLPVPLKDEEYAQLQVYIQSRQTGGQIDWENCNLFFLIDTPSLGETGISIHSLERQLSITLKNDQKTFADKMRPLVEKTVRSISELGYHIQDIQYQPFQRNAESIENQEEKDTKEGTLPFYTEKGFDYKV